MDMDEEFADEIRELMAAGQKIDAVKRYRQQTGAGLAEAKAAVEALEASGSPAQPVRAEDSGISDQIVGLLERGEKIQAVKLYREQRGVGLKEAKEAVERLARQNGLPTGSKGGCAGVILLGIVAGTSLLW